MAFTPQFNNDPTKGRGIIPPPPVPPLRKGMGNASMETPIPLPPAPPTIGIQRPPVPPAMTTPPPDPFAAKRQRDQAMGDAIREQRYAQRDQNPDIRRRLGQEQAPPMDPRREMQRRAFERMQPPVM